MEVMLGKVFERRQVYVQTLFAQKDPRVEGQTEEAVLNSLQLTNNGMIDLMNSWRTDHGSWVREETAEEYRTSKKCRNIEQGAFKRNNYPEPPYSFKACAAD